MSRYEEIKKQLILDPKVWLVTGVAGFIGSNLLETLLKLNQTVVGIDNFATGYKKNLDEVQNSVETEQWSRFTFVMGDITDHTICKNAVTGVDYVLHQAALGSVPRSISDPIKTNTTNISGFLNILHAAKEERVKSFTYAASSSTYGDHPSLPKVEENIGMPLSPYAITKYVNELYAGVYARTYGFKSIGLRYFNVFGKRQDPNGTYAAVIPKWILSMINNDHVFINGDGETSRDFCYIENVIKINILAATAEESSKDNVYNAAVGERTTLNQLFELIKQTLNELGCNYSSSPTFKEFRQGDVRHSLANINKSNKMLGYIPSHNIKDGIENSIPWYLDKFNKL